MLRIVVTVLLLAAWHFPTTFFAPSGPPYERGFVHWPFGKASAPVLDGFVGAIAPPGPVGGLSLALVLAGVASLAFVIAVAALWAIVLPSTWFAPAAVTGSVASIILFLLYLGPWAVVPIVLDAVILWGVLVAGWTQTSLAAS